jgi:hypothetical protein
VSKPPANLPCRLYAILAREASCGVIFRRGPSERVQIIHWNTATDELTTGQWFHGRIYERRCDLSPDGKLMIYFAINLKTRNVDSDYTYAWTAISKPPFLTALALWPKGNWWAGGGMFIGNRNIWLNHQEGEATPHPDHKPVDLQVTTDMGGRGEDEPILLRRLAREGWQHIQEWQGKFIQGAMQMAFEERMQAGQPTDLEWMLSLGDLNTHSRYVTYAPSIHEKPHSTQGLTLVMTTTVVGFQHRYAYSIRNGNGHEENLASAEWADWDQRGRLVFAQAGKLFAVEADALGQGPPRQLIDLNGNTPAPMEAPEWAKVW